jgi:hypothetical protein
MKKTSVLKNPTITPEVSDAIAMADKALAAGPRTSEAIKSNAASIETAREESVAAEEALAQAEAYAVTCDDADLPKANLAVAEAANKFEEKLQAFKRAVRLGSTLKDNSKTIDFNVTQARDALNAATTNLATTARNEIAAELNEVTKSVLKVLRRALALQTVLPNRDLGLAIAEIHIPNPAAWMQPFVMGDLLCLDGNSQRLTEIWRDDPDALKIFEAFKPIVEARQRLGRHIPFRETQPPTGHGYTIGGNPAAYKASRAVATPAKAEPAGQELNMGLAVNNADQAREV